MEDFERAVNLADRITTLEARYLGVEVDSPEYQHILKKNRRTYFEMLRLFDSRGQRFTISDPPDDVLLETIVEKYCTARPEAA